MTAILDVGDSDYETDIFYGDAYPLRPELMSTGVHTE